MLRAFVVCPFATNQNPLALSQYTLKELKPSLSI